MLRFANVVIIASLVLQLIAPALQPTMVYALETDDAAAIAAGLVALGDKLDELGYVEQLGDLLPLTAVSVSDDLGLALSHLFGDKLDADLDGFGGDLAALEAALANTRPIAGTEIAFTDVSSSVAGSVTDLTFSVTASHVDSLLPVAYYTDTVPLDLYGGAIRASFGLSTSLQFTYDSAGDPAAERLSLDPASTIVIVSTASGPIEAFESLFGFAAISVTGEVTWSERIVIDLRDPDDDGRITEDEWTHTAILDLVEIAYDAGSSVDAQLALDAQPVAPGAEELIPGSPDATLALYDIDWSDGLAAPSYALGDLAPFGNVKADDVLSGLAQFAVALMAAEAEVDGALPGGKLPFLQESWSDAFSIVAPLEAFIAEQGDAYILCGTADTDPPSGDATHLADGDPVFCQAPTVVQPDTVAWSIANGTIVGNDTVTETVGPNPSVNAAFTMDEAGSPNIELAFTMPDDPSTHRVTPRFRSLQELFARLSAPRFGFDATPSNVAFSPATYALTYRMINAVDAAATPVTWDFADQLKRDTGLYGLEATGSASAEVDAGVASLDVSFGVILIDDPADITPDEITDTVGLAPSMADRFYIGVHEGPEIELADIAFATTIELDGLLGFVEVDVQEGDSAIAQATGGAPALTVEITALPEGIPVSGTPGIADAIQIRRILSDTTGLIAPTVNLSMTAALDVEATIDDGATELGRGMVWINWPDVSAGRPEITVSQDYTDTLRVYDVVPSIYGTASILGLTEPVTDTLYDPRADFGEDLIGRELRNVSDGSRCLITGRTDGQTLVCASGLAGGADAQWEEGDLYEIAGDPTALRTVILEGLYGLASRMDAITPTAIISSELYFSPLPLIGVSPQALATQFDDVKDAIDAVRAGVPDAVIQCGITNTAILTGSLSELTLSEPGARTTFYCHAETSEDLPLSAVTWTATGADYDATEIPDGGGSGALTETVGAAPTARAVFEATDPAGIQVRVAFADTNGRHTATYPPAALPSSLQRLEAAIESKLGLQPEALQIAPDDLAHYSGGDPVRHLTFSLAQGICTPGHPGCSPTDQPVPAPRVEISAELGDSPDLIGIERTDTALLAYASRAQFDLAFPLTDTIPVTEVAVIESTGLTMTIDVSSTALDFEANMGPLSLAVGMSAAMTGTHKLLPAVGTHTGISSTTTMTDDAAVLVSDWGLVAGADTTITNTTAGEGWTCTVITLTDTVVTCSELPDPQRWEQHDTYEIAGPSQTVLYDPDATFIDELVGHVLTNVSDGGSNCVVSEVIDTHTLRCTSALTGGSDNTWSARDAYKVGAVGVLAFAGAFALFKDGVTPGDPVETFSIDDFAGGLRAALAGHNPGAECGDGVAGDACLRVSVLDLKAGDDPTFEPYLRVLKVAIPDLSNPDPASWDLVVPEDVTERIGAALLDFERLTFALDALRGSLLVALDGNEVGLMLPFLGTQLDAGADIAQTLRSDVIGQLADLGGALNDLGTTTTAHTVTHTISETVVSALGAGGSGLLLSAVEVTALCAGSACDDDAPVWELDDVRVSFVVGTEPEPQKDCAGDSCPASYDVPFDIGLPNVGLYSDDVVEAQVGWVLSMTFGISRDLGPYLDVGADDGPADLRLGASVRFKDAPSICHSEDPQIVSIEKLDHFSTRCLMGQIGILPVALRDGGDDGSTAWEGDDPSYLHMEVAVYLVSTAGTGEGTIAYGELEEYLTASIELDAKANVDLRFRSMFGFGGDEPYGFPTVLGTFHLSWDPENPGPDGDPVSGLLFDNLYLDPGSFITGFLEPLVGGVKQITKPLQPPIDVITTPLPVLSDISKLGGGGPVTLFTLMKAISRNDLTLIERMIGFISFVNNLPEQGILFGLGEDGEAGEFSLDTLIARTTGFIGSTPPSASKPCYMKMPTGGVRTAYCAYKTHQKYAKIKQELEKEEGEQAQKEQRRQEKQDDKRKENTRSKRETDAKKKVGSALKAGLKNHTKVVKDVNIVPPSVSFPFLDDSTQIFYALLGQDVTLIRVDLGSIEATTGVYFKFRIMAGPIPISVIIGGKATIRGRFAMGYDTRGFAPLLSGRAGFESLSGYSLLDGIYLDDFDAAGNDVPEIQLIIEVSIGAAVDLVIVSVGIEAGIIVTFALDFDDRLHDPPGSGKLRITTIANIENPFCLFVFSARGELFFRVFIEINLFLFTKKFSWEPFPRIELFKFEIKCEPPDPVLAAVDGAGTLTLNMGSPARRRARAVFKDREDERFIVRQLTPGIPAKVSVTAFGHTQEFSGVELVKADGGTDHDYIALEPGKDPDTEEEIPFTLRAEIHGGSGNDVINTGEGNDIVYGDAGKDRISTREGDDEVHGGSHSDTIAGGTGNDVLYGDAGNDSISGGPGSDYIDGGDDEDYVDGGPGTDEYSDEPGIPDLKDIVIGGRGEDTLRGHYGDDLIFGEDASCDKPTDFAACYAELGSVTTSEGGDGGAGDTMSGFDGNDWIVGGGDADAITGGAGNDTIHANGGDDAIDADDDNNRTPDGDDTVHAGSGDDIVYGRGGNDDLHGDADRDDLMGGAGRDRLYGGSENDFLMADEGTIPEHVAADHDLTPGGEAWKDLIRGFLPDNAMQDGVAIANCDPAEAKPVGGGNGDCLLGEGGNDILFGEGGYDRMWGDDVVEDEESDGADYMQGSRGEDHMVGGGGDDTMRGGLDEDEMYGDSGDDTMYGDSGNDYMEGNEGEDTLRGGIGDDDILGGGLPNWTSDDTGDWLYGDEGTDVILGDIGVVPVDTGTLPSYSRRKDVVYDDLITIKTTNPMTGGVDTIRGHVGSDILLGGADGDMIYGSTGTDYVIGDNGLVVRVEGVVQRVESTEPCTGGIDTIEGNEAPDILIGGAEGDTIYGNDGDDTILGDNGVVILSGADSPDVYTSDPSCGGSDTIHGNAGEDIILGGSGGVDLLGVSDFEGDTIHGNEGDDIALGDNGYITRTQEGETYRVLRIASTYPDQGANDTIHGDDGEDILLGGNDGDMIYGNWGRDTILGDNGVVVRADGTEEANDVYTSDPEYGGSDWIEGNEDDDLVLGGSGGTDLLDTEDAGDTIHGHSGGDILIGDNGYVTRNADDVVTEIDTTFPDMGGDDEIHGHDGEDVILGGSDGDHLYGGEHGDVILGDNGLLQYAVDGGGPALLLHATTTDPTIGGNDDIWAGAGIDLVFGGSYADVIRGGENHDILLGDHGLYDIGRPLDQPVLCIDTGAGDGGGVDEIHGDGGDDFIMGQQAGDWLYGDAGEDDITGGHNVPGGADGDDTMYGESDNAPGLPDGSGADVMLGDNAIVTRTLIAEDTWKNESWEMTTYNDTVERVVERYDVEAAGIEAPVQTYGDDDMWGNDNDDRMWGQGGEDEMWGGAGDDYMEGNAASDIMYGGSEQDDMLGGSGPRLTSDPSTAYESPTDRSTFERPVTIGDSEGVPVPLGDTMYGEGEADVILGDNGIIARSLQDGQWVTWVYSMSLDSFGAQLPRHPVGGAGTRVDRVVTMVDEAPGDTAGSDLIYGGSGDDDLYGQFDDTDPLLPAIGDELYGDAGEDAMLGDQGVVWSWPVTEDTQWIMPKEPFIDDHIYIQGTLFREVVLEQIGTGGDDRMRGGDGGDWMHGGYGPDLMNGNAGNDRMFGDDGDDVMWGGPHHDHLWGGYGMDHLDVRPRDESTPPPDPLVWHEYGGVDHYQDVDYVYGGWDQDAMQANIGDEGPVVGDRLLDWVGAYNVFYLCPGLYGEFVVTRDHSPHMLDFLLALSEGDGAHAPADPGASGWNELALVYAPDARLNSHPRHPDTPGHFVCDQALPTVRVIGIELPWSEKGGAYTVQGEVTVVDQQGQLARGATVTVTWSTPGGSETQVAVTNNKGVSTFVAPGSAVGTYRLDVDDVSLEGYAFESADSVLSREVPVGAGAAVLGTGEPRLASAGIQIW